MYNLNDLLKDFKKLKESLPKRVKKDLIKSSKKITQDIKKRITSGYGVDNMGDSPSNLKALSPGYIEQRKKSKLSSRTSASKSNLHNTGESVGSIKAKKYKDGIVIEPNEKGSERLAKQESNGRTGLNLSNKELDELEEQIEKSILNEINNIFK